MPTKRTETLWIKHRKRFLKAYLWIILFLLGLSSVIYCSWTENIKSPIDPEKPECISSELLWDNAGSDSTMRVIIDGNGDICVLGTFYNGGSEDIIVSKYHPNGTKIWQTTWGGTMKDRGHALAIDPQNNLYITGYTKSFDALEEDLLVIKYNSNGTIEWSKYLDLGNGKGQFGMGIVAYEDEAVYVTGYQWDYNFIIGDYQRLFIAKFNPSGTMMWCEFGEGPMGAGIGEDITVDQIGNLYIVGYYPIDDVVLLKYNENGTNLWETTWGSDTRIEWGKSLLFYDTTEIITCAGYIENEGSFLAQFTSSGELIQSKIDRATSIENLETANLKMVADDNGYILTPSVVFDQNQGINIAYLKKYDIFSLESIWELLLPEINPINGFGIAYNKKQNEIVAIGTQNQDNLLLIVKDGDNPFEVSYTTDELVYINLISLVVGICILGLLSSRYSIKSGVYLRNRIHSYIRYKKKELIIYLLKIHQIDENQYLKGSIKYYLAAFEKEQTHIWKNKRKKTIAFVKWLDKKKMAEEIDKTPPFGYNINIWENGLPSHHFKFFYGPMVTWMRSNNTWENTKNLIVYKFEAQDLAYKEAWKREYEKEYKFIEWLKDNFFNN